MNFERTDFSFETNEGHLSIIVLAAGLRNPNCLCKSVDMALLIAQDLSSEFFSHSSLFRLIILLARSNLFN